MVAAPGKCVCVLWVVESLFSASPWSAVPTHCQLVAARPARPPARSLMIGASQSSKRGALQAAWGWASVGRACPQRSRAQAHDTLGQRGEADLHQLLPSRVAFRDKAFHAFRR